MILTQVGLRAYLEEFTEQELQKLNAILSYPGDEDETVSLVYHDPISNKLYILDGHARTLREKDYGLEIVYNESFEKGVLANDLTKDILPGIELYDHQFSAVKKALYYKRGAIQIATGGGKTFTALAIIQYLLEKKLIPYGIIIVPSLFLAEQFHKDALDIGYDPLLCQVLSGASKPKPGFQLLIAVVNSASSRIKKVARGEILASEMKEKNRYIYDVITGTNCLIFDEAHGAKSQTSLEIALSCPDLEYFIGMSGSLYEDPTNHLADISDSVLKGIFYHDICFVSQQYLRKLGILAEPRLFIESTPGPVRKFRGSPVKLHKSYIVDNYVRNNKIEYFTNMFLKHGLSTLILVERKEHALKLLDTFKSERSIVLFGGGEAYRYDKLRGIKKFKSDFTKFKQEFNEGYYDLVIANIVLDQGVDIPALGALILAGGGKSKRRLIQRLGRVLRRKIIGPNYAFIVDFRDNAHMYHRKHSYIRFGVYDELNIIPYENKEEYLRELLIHGRELKKHQQG